MRAHDRRRSLSPKKTIYAAVAALSFVVLAGCAAQPARNHPDSAGARGAQLQADFGLMSKVYADKPLRVAINDLSASESRGALPWDVAELLKLAVNNLGGNIVLVTPGNQLGSGAVGAASSSDMAQPDVLISTGVIDFNKGSASPSQGAASNEANEKGPGADSEGSSTRATVNFQLIDAKTASAIPRMQAATSLTLQHVAADGPVIYEIRGDTLQLNGTDKANSGSGVALRQWAESSVVQVLGRYLKLPYWQVVPGFEPDSIVLDNIKADFAALNRAQQIQQFQHLLVLHGYDVALTGELDDPTRSAFDAAAKAHPDSGISSQWDANSYLALYLAVPVDHQTARKRQVLGASLDGRTVGKTVISQNGSLGIKLDSTTYRVGEHIVMNIQVGTPLYVRVGTVSSTGETWDLFPNRYQPDVLLQPGTKYQVPAESQPFQLEIVGPAGVDKIFVVGRSQRFPKDYALFDANGKIAPPNPDLDEARVDVSFTVVD